MFFFMLCSILFLRYFVFCLSFIFSFILHPLMHLDPCSYLLFFPLSSCFIFLFMTKREKAYKRVYQSVSSFQYDSCAYSQGKKFYLVYIHRGRNSIREMHILRGRRHLLWKNLILLYACFLVALWCFDLCLVSLFYFSHRIIFMCWTCIYPYVIVLYWLHV